MNARNGQHEAIWRDSMYKVDKSKSENIYCAVSRCCSVSSKISEKQIRNLSKAWIRRRRKISSFLIINPNKRRQNSFIKPTCSRDLNNILNSGHKCILSGNKAWADLILDESNNWWQVARSVWADQLKASQQRIKGSGAKSFRYSTRKIYLKFHVFFKGIAVVKYVQKLKCWEINVARLPWCALTSHTIVLFKQRRIVPSFLNSNVDVS